MSLFRRRPARPPIQLHARPFTEAELAEHFRRGKRDNAEWYQALRQVLGEMLEERYEIIGNPALVNPNDSRAHAAGGIAALNDLADWIERPGGMERPPVEPEE